MNVAAISTELQRRLATIFETVYPRPPAAPVFPCAIVHFPVVTSYHVEMAHSVCRMTWQVSVAAGRGDTDDAFDTLATWLSTDGAASVRDALEAKRDDTTPWLRLALIESSSPDVNTESIEVTFTIEIDA
jgi:hypothetical protein